MGRAQAGGEVNHQLRGRGGGHRQRQHIRPCAGEHTSEPANPPTHPPTHARARRVSQRATNSGIRTKKMVARTSPRPPPFLKPWPLSNCRLLLKRAAWQARSAVLLCPYQPGKGRLIFETAHAATKAPPVLKAAKLSEKPALLNTTTPESTALVLSERALPGFYRFFYCARTQIKRNSFFMMKAAGPARNSSYFSQGPYPASPFFMCASPRKKWPNFPPEVLSDREIFLLY